MFLLQMAAAEKKCELEIEIMQRSNEFLLLSKSFREKMKRIEERIQEELTSDAECRIMDLVFSHCFMLSPFVFKGLQKFSLKNGIKNSLRIGNWRSC